jgi:hypothetical protein
LLRQLHFRALDADFIRPGLNGCFMVVLPVLEGEARDRVDDTEPRWLLTALKEMGRWAYQVRSIGES